MFHIEISQAKSLGFRNSNFGFVWDWSETDASPDIRISNFMNHQRDDF